MKKSFITMTLFLIFMFLTTSIPARQGSGLDVDIAVICKSVVEREPLGIGISFPVSLGELYCFTRIIGARMPTQITHVWYYGQEERSRVDLPINSSKWRTFSQKKIQSHETGSWHVDILDSEGNVLKVVQFIVTAEPETVNDMSQPHAPVLD